MRIAKWQVPSIRNTNLSLKLRMARKLGPYEMIEPRIYYLLTGCKGRIMKY